MELKDVKSPQDLKHCSVEELNHLATQIRETIIGQVAKHGGHLASSLGVVELTLALHYVFNAPDDKIVWDVGHQACRCPRPFQPQKQRGRCHWRWLHDGRYGLRGYQ